MNSKPRTGLRGILSTSRSLRRSETAVTDTIRGVVREIQFHEDAAARTPGSLPGHWCDTHCVVRLHGRSGRTQCRLDRRDHATDRAPGERLAADLATSPDLAGAGGLILLRKLYPEAVEIVLPAGTWKREEVQ